ncbi:ATP-binding cassette domain-containing protein [Demequina litorisediminis]|uniref:ABC transporter domain-containing protein n=1 Tax=Demequina litorisediminis TaxID=1849022 RepID=A0ABQ6IHL1_9MICO|nr:hypothetical protein GCM10025876_35790 [Demequina litorisediminis]
MIEFKDAGVTAPDTGVTILKPTSLTLTERRVSVIGANGGGKSTLVRLINGLIPATTGSVEVDGLDVARKGPEVRRKVGFLFTDPSAQAHHADGHRGRHAVASTHHQGPGRAHPRRTRRPRRDGSW